MGAAGRMTVVLLGTGTSQGVPMLGCSCAVCRSRDPRDRRLRCSAWVRAGDLSLVIDPGPDFRAQALRAKIRRVDAVLLTHAHFDHIAGMDDLRVFCCHGRQKLPVYGNAPTLRAVRSRFEYAFRRTQEGGGKPAFSLRPAPGPFTFSGLRLIPVPLRHGRLKILGWRMGPFAYLTDVSRIPGPSFALLRRLKVLVLDALRPRPHPTHFSLGEAVEAAARIRAGRTYFTHVTHDLPHRMTEKRLPSRVHVAFDGLKLAF